MRTGSVVSVWIILDGRPTNAYHDRADVGIADAGLERGEEVVSQVLLTGVVVVAITSSLQIVHCVVFAGGYDLLADHWRQSSSGL